MGDQGHANNVNNMEAFVALLTGLGGDYAPGNGDLSLAKFTTRLTEGQDNWDAYGTSKAARKMQETNRENRYGAAEDQLMASINYYDSTSAPENRKEDVHEIRRRWRGVRASPPPVDDPNTPENEAENTNSSAQTGYVQRAEHFDSALDIYTADGTYSPTEANLKVDALQTTSDELHGSNTSVITSIADFGTKRLAFFKTMYTAPNHALEMVRLSKKYLKAALGPDHLVYKQAIALKFRYPKL
jgi:hypothetical protein